MKNHELLSGAMLINSLASQDAPLAVALKIRKLRKEIIAQAEIVENMRTELATKHGTKSADGQSFTLTEEGVKVINDWLMLENDFKCAQLSLDDLKDMKIKAALLEAAAWLIKE